MYLSDELVTEPKIPSTVTKIKNYAFHGYGGLTGVEIPNNMTDIGYCAFFDCPKLTNITMGSGVTSIGGLAFRYCDSLTEINFRGTKERWVLVTKGDHWKYGTSFTVRCIDGDISNKDA